MNLPDILRTLGIEFRDSGEHRNVREGWVGVDCPYCSAGSGKFKLGISPRSLAATCWSCGRYRLGEVLAKASRIPIRDVLVLLGQVDRLSEYETKFRPSGTLKLPDDMGDLLPAHRRYLEQRGFDPDELVELWGVRGVGPDGGRFRWRLLLPVFEDRKIVSYQCRAVGRDVIPRYLAADPADESLPLKHCLGGEQHARHSIAVVEGYFQAMRVGRGAVATMGLGYTEHQLLRIAEYPSRVICFDNEPTAQRRAHELADALAVFPGETAVVCLSGAQPDTSPLDELVELRERFLQ